MDWDDISSIFRRPRGLKLSSSISWGKPSVCTVKSPDIQVSASQRAVFTDLVFARYNGTCVWTYGIVSSDVEALRHK